MARETNLIDSAVNVAEVIHGYAEEGLGTRKLSY